MGLHWDNATERGKEKGRWKREKDAILWEDENEIISDGKLRRGI